MIKGILISVQSKCVYYSNFDAELAPSPELLGSFLSALNLYARQIRQEQLKAIIMGKRTLYLYELAKEHEIFLVVIADRSGKETEIKMIIQEIKNAFLDCFNVKEIYSYSSRPDYFDNFNTTVNIILFNYLGVVNI